MRVKNWSILADVKTRVKNGLMQKPIWFEGAVTNPPAFHYGDSRGTKPKELVFPEDRLRKIFLRRHPEVAFYPMRLSPQDATLPPISSTADIFASKQLEYMQQGLTERTAYKKAEKWLKEKQFASELEVILAGKHLEELEPEVERKAKTLSDELEDVRDEFISAYLRREVTETRERRFALEELVRSRRDTGDTEPFTVGELSNYNAEDLEHHMRLFPGDVKYFEPAYTIMAARTTKVKEQKRDKFILEDKDFEEVEEQREAPVEQVVAPAEPWDDEFSRMFGQEEEEEAAKKGREKEQGEIEGTYEPTDVPKEEEK